MRGEWNSCSNFSAITRLETLATQAIIIALHIGVGMIILFRVTLVYSGWQGNLCKNTLAHEEGGCNLLSGHPLIISDIRSWTEVTLLFFRRICSRRPSMTKTASSWLVPWSSLGKLSSWLNWNIRDSGESVLVTSFGKSSSGESVTSEHLRAALVQNL